MTTTITIEHPDNTQDDILFHQNSVGGARCGVKFNPDENPDVRLLKSLAAGFMEACDQYLKSRKDDDGDGKRSFATAMTQMESAQMFAVKGLFTRRNAGKE